MMKAKSVSEWVSSAFGSSRQPAARPPPPAKRRHTAATGSATSSRSSRGRATCSGTRDTPVSVPGRDEGSVPWSVKYRPTTIDDLVVHKKKVADVQQWLEYAFSERSSCPIILLSGPTGCGKTATIHTLSHTMGYSIVEWSNAVDITPIGVGSDDIRPDWELYESQTKQFHNFLTRANRYPSLQLGGGSSSSGGNKRERKVVIVEEFPNAFLRDPSKLHTILRNFVSSGSRTLSPLVLIVSDSHQSSSSSHLLPPSLLNDLNIHNIIFNPVAHTNMVKVLQKIANAECSSRRGFSHSQKRYHMPSKEVIEAISVSSGGDVRNAVNTLQFTCLKDPCSLIVTEVSDVTSHTSQQRKRKKGSRSDKDIPQLIGVAGKDTTLFLFRALGKILYAKRSDESDSSVSSLPAHLAHCHRAPLLVNPEAVFSTAHMSGSLFSLFLHHNYPPLCEEMDDISTASEYLSITDLLTSKWTDSPEEQQMCESCASSLMTRSLLYANTHHSQSKWRPLHKPQWTTVQQQYTTNSKAARSLFLHLTASRHSHLWTPVELQTQILPYMAVINSTLRNPSQANLLHTITRFRQNYSRTTEQLGEREPLESVGDTSQEPQTPRLADCGASSHDTLTLSQSSAVTGYSVEPEREEEEEAIEEFDDDLFW